MLDPFFRDVSKDLTIGNIDSFWYKNTVNYEYARSLLSRFWREVTWVKPEHYITPGTTAMICLITMLVRRHSKRVFVYWPTYDTALRIFRENEMNITDIKGCEEKLCDISGWRWGMLYITTQHNNPDWYTIPQDVLKRIVILCKENDILIVEDDPYFFIWNILDRHVSTYTDTGYLYLNSFSKILSPTYRIGTISGDYSIIKQLLPMIQNLWWPNMLWLLKVFDEIQDRELQPWEWLETGWMGLYKKAQNECAQRRVDIDCKWFYIWRNKDELLYTRLMKHWYEVKDGSVFWHKYHDMFRASYQHLSPDWLTALKAIMR